MVWVVSKFRLKAPPGISSPYISPHTHTFGTKFMGVPTSEVGYTFATTRRDVHEVQKNM
jgi:hypothetical protein